MKRLQSHLHKIILPLVTTILLGSCVAYQKQPTPLDEIDFSEVVEKRLRLKVLKNDRRENLVPLKYAADTLFVRLPNTVQQSSIKTSIYVPNMAYDEIYLQDKKQSNVRTGFLVGGGALLGVMIGMLVKTANDLSNTFVP